MTTEFTSNGNDGSGGFIHIIQEANCRVAYTLNNRQPVRCSIIGDQPLFYMDFEGDIEEEFADEDPFGIGMIEQGVAALKAKILETEYHSLGAGTLSEKGQIRLADFMDDSRAMLEPAGSQTSLQISTGDLRLRALEKTIASSRLAAAFLDHARQYKIRMEFSRQVELSFYDRDAGVVFLNPDRDDANLVLLALKELRRVWQHKNGALLNPLTFHPDQAILINRAQKADLAVAMLRGAWEMQLSGNKGPWERLEESSMSDLTCAFAREAYLDFRTLNNGQAASAVFESWFLSDRCRLEDRALIQHMLSDYQGYVFESEQASKTVSADLMVALGTMPFGKNYLSPFMNTILADPLFAEVRDRSNANFLWFIKFERSFRDAEQELQTSPTIQTHAHPHGNSITNKKTDGDDEQTATVIALPGRAENPARGRTGRMAAGGSGTGNIVYFDRNSVKR